MAKIKKSLIFTTFNEQNTISRLIESILKQTVLPDEVVMVDGGSHDLTVEQAKESIKDTRLAKRMKIYVKKGNRSVGRNEAIKRSKAEIIAITDAGCILDKNWFKNITNAFADKKVDVVAGYYKAKTTTVFEKCIAAYVLVMPDRVNPDTFLPATRSMAMKKKVLKKGGKFDPKLSNNEDYAFARRLKKMKANIKFVKNAIVYWIPRNNLKTAFIMFYRFAKGDIEAKIVRPKVILIFMRYIVAFALLFAQSYLFLIILITLYILWSIAKNYKYVNQPSAIIYLPLIQVTSDLAVISGSLAPFF